MARQREIRFLSWSDGQLSIARRSRVGERYNNETGKYDKSDALNEQVDIENYSATEVEELRKELLKH